MHSKKLQQTLPPPQYPITGDLIMWIRTKMAYATTDLLQNPQRNLPVEIIPIKIKTESVTTGKHQITLKMLKEKTMLTRTMTAFVITDKTTTGTVAEKDIATAMENATAMDAGTDTVGEININNDDKTGKSFPRTKFY